MEFKESLDIVLRDCKFLLGASDLRHLLPGVDGFIPPLTAIRFTDNEAPRFTWGFPVVHGRHLMWVLHQFLTLEAMKCLANPAYQENLRLLTPAELKEDVYFKVLSDFLLKTLSEGSFLKLDSVLWIYLSDFVNRRLNQDEASDRLLATLSPNEYSKLRSIDPELNRLRYKEPKRFADVRVKVLRSLFARNDFANSCMKDVFDEVPNNPLNREMIANRLVYTERPDPIYRNLDLTEAFLVKGYKFTATDFTGINRALRIVISGILSRANSDRLLPLDSYFLKRFVTDEARHKATGLPSQGHGLERAGTPKEVAEGEEREKLAYLLSLQEEPARYLLWHLEDKEYYKPIERVGTIPREMVKALRYRASAIVLEELYTEVTRDLLRWDFFHSLQSRLRPVTRKGEVFYSDTRPMARTTVPLNLDSFYEIFRRSRYGTAVFFDLVGFTDRTKALTRELQEAAARGDKERFDLSSISLAIQRVFAVRNHLDHFGGIPQGFEGDAILDMFPRAIDALRYVTSFVDNYTKNRYIRFRPFERPTENPYREGFRVGLASGEYSLISIVGRTNELIGENSTDRAVGHTINRASRLNSGKKGDKYLVLGEEPEVASEVMDPFNLLKVRVNDKKELNNNGIASFEDTFLEIREQVKAEGMSWYEPLTGRGTSIGGLMPKFRNYEFELVFEDPRAKRIYCVRRLTRQPELKGLEDEILTIYEYLLFELAEFQAFAERDAQHTPAQISLPPPVVEAVAPVEVGEIQEVESPLIGSRSTFDWQDMVDDEAADLQSRLGLGLSEISRGDDAVRAALDRHKTGFEAWAEQQSAPRSLGEVWEVESSTPEGPSFRLGDYEESGPGLPSASALDRSALGDELENVDTEEDSGYLTSSQTPGISLALDWSATAPEALGGDVLADELEVPVSGRTMALGSALEPDAEPESSDTPTSPLELGGFEFDFSGEEELESALGPAPLSLPRPPEGSGRELDALRAMPGAAMPKRGEAGPAPSAPDLSSRDLSSLDMSSPGLSSPDMSSLDLSSLDMSSPGLSSLDMSLLDMSSPGLSSPGLSSLGGMDDSAGGSGLDLSALELSTQDEPDEAKRAAFDQRSPERPDESPDRSELERNWEALQALGGSSLDFSALDGLEQDSWVGHALGEDEDVEPLTEVVSPAGPEEDDGDSDEGLDLGIYLEWRGAPEIRELVEELAVDLGRGLERGGAARTERGASTERSSSGGGRASDADVRAGTYSMGTRGRIVESIGRPSRGRPVPSREVTGRQAIIPDFTLLFPGYVYSVAAQDLGGQETRVLIARMNGDQFEDVHIYSAGPIGDEPWALEPLFMRFLEEKDRTRFELSSATRDIAGPFSAGVTPLPIAYLERLYRELKSGRGR